MSEKMDYRAAAQGLIKEWREFIATPLHESSFLDGKEMVDYVDEDSHASDDKLQLLILALLDKVRQEQVVEMPTEEQVLRFLSERGLVVTSIEVLKSLAKPEMVTGSDGKQYSIDSKDIPG